MFIDFYEKSNFFIKKIIESSLRISDILIVTSPSWISKIRNIMKQEKQIEVVYNGFDEEIFHPMDRIECRKLLSLPKKQKILLTIGNLIPEKNHMLLIDALDIIINQKGMENIYCVIIGDGPLYNKIHSRIEEKGLQEYITNISHVSHQRIVYWINASDIFILPSSYEGNPTVMFEELACGKPFIGSNVGGIPDIINSEKYGILVKPGDLNDLIEKITIGLDKRWDENSIINYSKNYSWNQITKKLLKIYKKDYSN
jgi:glycosyltransferase involved in cell wall biosynthesis